MTPEPWQRLPEHSPVQPAALTPCALLLAGGLHAQCQKVDAKKGPQHSKTRKNRQKSLDTDTATDFNKRCIKGLPLLTFFKSIHFKRKFHSLRLESWSHLWIFVINIFGNRETSLSKNLVKANIVFMSSTKTKGGEKWIIWNSAPWLFFLP